MNISRALSAFMLTAVLMTQQLPAQIDRTKQPAADPPPKASFPAFETFSLQNGLKVFFIHDDRPLVTFRMLVRGGNSRDPVPSVADFTADLLTKGTATRSAHDFAEKIDFVGGSVGASASADAIIVTATGLKKHLPVILEMFSDAVMHPAYSTEEIEKYRQEQITGLKSAKARSEFLADYAINKLLYGSTPYGSMPTEESLTRVTQEMIKAYHHTYFVPNNTTLAVVGDFSRDDVQKIVQGTFGSWKGGPLPIVPQPKFPERTGRRIVLVDRPTSVQSSIRVIGKGPMLSDYKDRPRTFILNSMLGGGTGLGNRLAMNLRETHAYTYTPFSSFDGNLHAGRWVAGADVRNSVTDSALKEMFHEIERIQTEEPPADELNRNVQSSVGGFLMSIADPNVTAMRVQSIDFYGLPDDYYSKLIPAYAGTTGKEIRDLAKKYLSTEDLAVVVIGKASEVRTKLAPFGQVELWDSDLNPMEDNAQIDVGIKAEDLWKKMVNAMGGEKKMKSVTSRSFTGKVSGGPRDQQMNGTYKVTEAAPNKLYFEINLGAGKMERFINGTRALDVRTMGSGGPKGMSKEFEVIEPELTRVMEATHIMPEAYLSEMKGALRTAGTKEVGGKKALILEVKFPKGTQVRYFIDPETSLPIRKEIRDGSSVSYADWRPVEGVMMPHKMEIEMGTANPLTVRDVKYEVNKPVEDTLFR